MTKYKFESSFGADVAITHATTYFWRKRGAEGKTKKKDIADAINRLIVCGYKRFQELEKMERRELQEKMYQRDLKDECYICGKDPKARKLCSRCPPLCKKCGKPLPAISGHVFPCPVCDEE